MVELSEIDKFLCYSIQSNGNNVLHELNLDADSNILKIMRNNFSRFWNLLSKEQRKQYIKLSVEKEELYDIMEKIIRYSCEVSRNNFMKDFMNLDLLRDVDLYGIKFINCSSDDVDVYNDLKHNILKFWMSLTKEKKEKIILIINKYWQMNKHKEFIKIPYVDKCNNYKCFNCECFDCDNQGLKNIDLLYDDDVELINCSGNNITKLDDLPVGLKVLYCEYNKLTSLNNLPPELKILNCRGNNINELLHLPLSLIWLDCGDCGDAGINQIEIPAYLEVFHCEDAVINLELFPNMLNEIHLGNTEGDIKWKLPYGLEKITLANKLCYEKYINIPKSVKFFNNEKLRNDFLL